jgi:hypothetical protein
MRKTAFNLLGYSSLVLIVYGGLMSQVNAATHARANSLIRIWIVGPHTGDLPKPIVPSQFRRQVDAFGQVKPCRPQRHAKLPSIADLTYSKARKKLLAAGWKPLQTKSSNEAEQDPDIKYGNGLLFWRLGYVEVEACSGTGVAACAFLFRDIHGNRLRVNTSGEELPKEKMYARVSGVRFLCD